MKEKLRIDRRACCYCGACVGACPADALVLRDTELRLDEEKCTLCRFCLVCCPVDAISAGPMDDSGSKQETDVLRTDAVVVGAGPAGSICARYLAQAGVRVLVVEKKQEIGVPKRCAEAVEPDTFEAAGIEPHPLWLANRIHAAVLYAPNGRSVSFGSRSSTESGYIIERKIFEKHLAKDAILAGARYLLKTTALDVIKDDDQVKGVVVEYMGMPKKISARIVIAADGVASMIAKTACLKTINRLKNYMSCFQYEMAGVRNVDEKAIHLYYGNRIAPGGYVWIFPKGNTLANVGVGIKPLKKGGKAPKTYLDEFIEKHPLIFENASAVEFNSGAVPVHRTVETLVGDGLMVIGDAAQLVNPISGSGIRLAMISGRLAAEVAAKALQRGDVGRRSLGEYQKKWDAQHGRRLDKMLKLQRFTDRLADEELNRLAEILTGPILEELANGRFFGFMKLLMKKLPSLAPLAVKYLRS